MRSGKCLSKVNLLHRTVGAVAFDFEYTRSHEHAESCLLQYSFATVVASIVAVLLMFVLTISGIV